MRALAALFLVAGLAYAEDLVTPAATANYGTQVLLNRGAFRADKAVNFYDQFYFTVGAQLSSQSAGGKGIVWGAATGATATGTSQDWLVGLESGVFSANPNARWITAINTVIGCRDWDMVLAGTPCSGPNNIQSRAIWISSADPGMTGFESALKLDNSALYSMPGRPKPAVIDLRDVDETKLAGWCLIATATRCITIDDLKK